MRLTKQTDRKGCQSAPTKKKFIADKNVRPKVESTASRDLADSAEKASSAQRSYCFGDPGMYTYFAQQLTNGAPPFHPGYPHYFPVSMQPLYTMPPDAGGYGYSMYQATYQRASDPRMRAYNPYSEGIKKMEMKMDMSSFPESYRLQGMHQYASGAGNQLAFDEYEATAMQRNAAVNSQSDFPNRKVPMTSLNHIEKPFICDYCEKGFSCRSSLRRHVRLHTGQNLFYCSACGKGFSDRGTRDSHFRTHTGEKPFKCDQCDRCFGQKGNLNRHKRIHKSEVSGIRSRNSEKMSQPLMVPAGIFSRK